jgi:hypothetical protein
MSKKRAAAEADQGATKKAKAAVAAVPVSVNGVNNIFPFLFSIFGTVQSDVCLFIADFYLGRYRG